MRRKAAIAGVAAMLLAGVGGCAGEQSPSADEHASKTPATTAASSPPKASVSPVEAAPTVRVKLKAGEVVSGGGVHKVKLGSKVVIEIIADVADEAHMHGYDKTVKTQPGKPVRMSFKADIPGIFKIELHEAGTTLCELQIQ